MERRLRASEQATHHRLLEGMLLRMACLPDAGQFILRGGMLMRLWFRPLLRAAGDLDVVATYPFNIEETAQRFQWVLANQDIDDGVVFDPDRYRAEGIWLHTNFPGVRIHTIGEVDGTEADFSVDVTFGEPLIPEPVFAEYPMLSSELTTHLWMCRPETIVGRKLHALMAMGMLHWRPKDLNDLRLLLNRVPMDDSQLPTAIAASFTSRGNPPDEARAIFDHERWTMKTSAARWHDFVVQARGQEVPRKLATVVTEVAERLDPILEQLV